MADDVMALLNEDDEMILALEAQLREVQSSIDNIMKAIEKGVVTRTTKTRLEELEAEEEKSNGISKLKKINVQRLPRISYCSRSISSEISISDLRKIRSV